MNKNIVFMFSGQGSQYYNMGKELFSNNITFKKWMIRMDDLAYEITHRSILEFLYNEKRSKSEIFDSTSYTHPAIFMVEYAMAQVLLEYGITPSYVLGTSLGEFSSVAVSNVLSLYDSLEAVLKQSEFLESYCSKAGMLAIIYNYKLYEENPLLNENTELVSVNYDSHFVVSGDFSALNNIKLFLDKNDIMYQMLPVSCGFHSKLINNAQSTFKNYIDKKTLSEPEIPFLSGVYGTPIKFINNEYLWDVIRKPIKFRENIKKLELDNTYTYIDLGPMGTLASFVKQNLSINSVSEVYSIITPFGNEIKNLEKFFISAELR